MNDSDKTKTLHDLIKDIRFAMFTTRGPDGSLRSRPMTTQNDPDRDPECLWFFAARSGGPVTDLLRDPAVNAAFADPSSDAYVSVSGSAAVVEDDERKQKLWSKFAEAWFPDVPVFGILDRYSDEGEIRIRRAAREPGFGELRP